MNKSGKITASDKYLEYLYSTQRMRLKDIAELFGCDTSAVSQRFKKAGIKTRNAHDYPTSEKQKQAWVEIGKRRKGQTLSEEAKAKISASAKGRRKRNDYQFGGHEKTRSDGYIKVYVPDHPNCTADGYVMKHILVVEQSIGRYLKPNECVHHINHIRNDNRLENLLLMTKHDHMSMHMKERHEIRRNNEC